jgi:succinate dehydrogenase / fumarate reductase membrane anchor subunit
MYHAWVGVRDIYMDYIKPTSVRLVLHAVTLLLLIGYLGWAAQVLWRL